MGCFNVVARSICSLEGAGRPPWSPLREGQHCTHVLGKGYASQLCAATAPECQHTDDVLRKDHVHLVYGKDTKAVLLEVPLSLAALNAKVEVLAKCVASSPIA